LSGCLQPRPHQLIDAVELSEIKVPFRNLEESEEVHVRALGRMLYQLIEDGKDIVDVFLGCAFHFHLFTTADQVREEIVN